MRECPGGKPGRGVKAEGNTIRLPEVGRRARPARRKKTCWSLPHHRPTWIFLKGLSQSVFVGTRKIVNYG